jgi:hypothetical protein
MAQAVSRWPLIAEARVRGRSSSCGICGGQSGTGTSFSQCSSVSSVVTFHHCSILVYHRSISSEISLTKQHIIIPSVLVRGFISDLTLGRNRGNKEFSTTARFCCRFRRFG